MPARAAGGVRSPEDIFSHYAYFSSYSDSWVQHAADYVAGAVSRLGSGAGVVRG